MPPSFSLSPFQILTEILLFSAISVNGWMVPAFNGGRQSLVQPRRGTAKKPCAAECTTQTQNRSSSRRNFLQDSFDLSSTLAILVGASYPAVAVAVAAADPFAQLDSIAGAIISSDKGSSGDKSYPMPPSPLPKTNGNDDAESSDLAKSQQSPNSSSNTGGGGTNNLSEMDAALQESRKRKRIDPRTHG